MLHAPQSHTASRLPAAARPAARPAPFTPCLCDPRQGATAFNQPLSWDTARVTKTWQMFSVCSHPRCSLPVCPRKLRSRPLPCMLRAPRSHAASRLTPRQRATAFNQPLSWDTSSVTNMRDMFSVLHATLTAPVSPNLHSHALFLLHAACTAIARVYTREGRLMPRPSYTQCIPSPVALAECKRRRC